MTFIGFQNGNWEYVTIEQLDKPTYLFRYITVHKQFYPTFIEGILMVLLSKNRPYNIAELPNQRFKIDFPF